MLNTLTHARVQRPREKTCGHRTGGAAAGARQSRGARRTPRTSPRAAPRRSALSSRRAPLRRRVAVAAAASPRPLAPYVASAVKCCAGCVRNASVVSIIYSGYLGEPASLEVGHMYY